MGLDMYLTKKTYVGANYEHRNVEANINITVDKQPLNVNTKKVTCIEEEVMYWRKANAIHGWFVDNVQNGEDDCDSYELSRSKLQELLNACKQELAAKNNPEAETALEPRAGFFFGGNEKDEWFYDSIKDTIETLSKELDSNDENQEVEYFYQSSW